MLHVTSEELELLMSELCYIVMFELKLIWVEEKFVGCDNIYQSLPMDYAPRLIDEFVSPMYINNIGLLTYFCL